MEKQAPDTCEEAETAVLIEYNNDGNVRTRARAPNYKRAVVATLSVASIIILLLACLASSKSSTMQKSMATDVTELYAQADNWKCAEGQCVATGGFFSRAEQWYAQDQAKCHKHPHRVSNLHSCKSACKGSKFKNLYHYEEQCLCCEIAICSTYKHYPLFSTTGFSWYKSLSGRHTCTKIVAGLKGVWHYIKCSSSESTFTYQVGMAKTNEWSKDITTQLVTGVAGTGVEGSVATTLSQSSSVENSVSKSSEEPLKPHPGQQLCAFQYALHIAGPEEDDASIQWTMDFERSDSPHHVPQCVPGNFDLSDPTKQKCTSPKYRIGSE